MLIELGGHRFLTDPTFDPPGEYPSGAITLEKLAGPSVSPDRIAPVHAVLLSHDQHSDNLDRSGRAFLQHAGATFTTIAGAKRLGGNSHGLAPYETIASTCGHGADVLVTGAPARHGPVGIEPMSGDVIGFLIGIQEPGDAVYVTGDTVWFDGVAEVARRYRPKLVIAFAGAAEPRGPYRMTMDSNDVIETAHAFPDARILAIHTHGWAHFKQSQGDLYRAFSALGISDRLLLVQPGETVQIPIL